MKRKSVWSFPELSDDENAIVIKARELGYAAFFPCFPSALDQATNTLKGAREFLALKEGAPHDPA